MQPDRTSHLSHVRQTTGATDKRGTRHTGRRTTLPEKKQQLLPYVTPAGIFPYCKELCLTLPSGLFVIDIDHLDTAAEAEEWRNRLFADDVLHPDLAFISPGAKESNCSSLIGYVRTKASKNRSTKPCIPPGTTSNGNTA